MVFYTLVVYNINEDKYINLWYKNLHREQNKKYRYLGMVFYTLVVYNIKEDKVTKQRTKALCADMSTLQESEKESRSYTAGGLICLFSCRGVSCDEVV